MQFTIEVRKSALLIFILILTHIGLSQVFIPFGFLSSARPNLVISDANTYNYGSISISVAVDKVFTVTNNGQSVASAITAAAFTNPSVYSYKGGSYPGTGGTCSGTLNFAASCTLVVTANGSSTGSVNDTIRLNYLGRVSQFTQRAITATFINTATQLAWVSLPLFFRVSDCQAATIQRQDSAGNPVTIGVATTINSLLFNNGINGSYFSNSGCSAPAGTPAIAAGTNSITVYFRSTTSGQTGILVATAASLTSASQNVTITSAPTKLFVNSALVMKTNTCVPVSVYTVDASNFNSNAVTTVNVNLTTAGSNIYYSDSSCTSPITAVSILAGTFLRTFYTQNAVAETANLIAADAAIVLASSSKSVNFNPTLTWWNSLWMNRIRIDINNSDQAAAFTNQPILVKLNPTLINYANIQASGSDIRFVASDDVTALDYEFDSWSSGGNSEIWVRVPSIAASSSSGFIYLYFNNPTVLDAQNKNGVWSNYWSVWHLGEDPGAAAPQYIDSTGSGRNGTATNTPARGSGQIGLGANFTTSVLDYILISSNLTALSTGNFTFSAWMRTSQAGTANTWTSPGLTGIEVSGLATDLFVGWIDTTGLIGITYGNTPHAKSNFSVNTNAWIHVTMTRNFTTGAAVFYVNGVANGSNTTATGTINSFNRLGSMINAVNYNGFLDEVRIYNSVQTPAQIQADFKFMMNTHLIYNIVEVGP